MRIVAIGAGLLLLTACQRNESPPVVGVENDTVAGKTSPLGADIEGDLWRVESADEEVVLVPEASEIHLQAGGRELRMTSQEFQGLLGGDQRADSGRARAGMKVRVIRDADGKLSKLVLIP